MRIEHLALLAALCSSMSFSSASVLFARFSSEVSVVWMNTFKACICALGMAAILAARGLSPVSSSSLLLLAGSGAIGLGIGDLFLLTAFARIGAARTLMLYGFQPILVGVGSALLFGQSVGPERCIAIAFFMLCLFLLSFERYKKDGHWELRGLAFALIGVLLDNVGVFMTRFSFDQSPNLDPFEANLIRALGAVAVFGILSRFRPVHLAKRWKALSARDQGMVTIAALAGTALSLSFYMFAIKNGHLASVSGIALSVPLFSALLECIAQRKRPSRYLVGGLVSLLTGMGIALSAT